MAKQSQRQKEIVGRVMHEFKRGELESGSGRKVRNPRQAVAIGLSEAGASRQQSAEENRRRRSRTESRERSGQSASQRSGEHSKAQLYEEAKKRDIPGRSKMDKEQLRRALKR